MTGFLFFSARASSDAVPGPSTPQAITTQAERPTRLLRAFCMSVFSAMSTDSATLASRPGSKPIVMPFPLFFAPSLTARITPASRPPLTMIHPLSANASPSALASDIALFSSGTVRGCSEPVPTTATMAFPLNCHLPVERWNRAPESRYRERAEAASHAEVGDQSWSLVRWDIVRSILCGSRCELRRNPERSSIKSRNPQETRTQYLLTTMHLSIKLDELVLDLSVKMDDV